MPLPLEEEFEALLAPLPGKNPAGEPVPYPVREELDEARKEVNPDDFPPDYPGRPELKRANWAGIIRRCVKLLESSSKDLMTGARLTEALAKENGFAGVGSGLRILRGLIEEAWDRMYPEIEEGDLEVRSAPFTWLDDPVRGARFPSALRSLPLVRGAEDKASFSCLDWDNAKAGKGVPMELIEKGVQATSREESQETFDALDGAVAELGKLIYALDAKMGEYAPALLEVRKALEQCHQLARQVLERKGPAPAAAGAAAAPANGAAAPPGAAPAAVAPPPGGTREELYAALASAASRLQRVEPHSPIPILIQLAVELGTMPFPQLMGALAKNQLMSALIRDPAILQEIGRAATAASSSQ